MFYVKRNGARTNSSFISSIPSQRIANRTPEI
jgi:hypothetical protein